jgi:hypothetical protein
MRTGASEGLLIDEILRFAQNDTEADHGKVALSMGNVWETGR